MSSWRIKVESWYHRMMTLELSKFEEGESAETTGGRKAESVNVDDFGSA